MYEIAYSRQAVKALQRMPRQTARRLRARLEQIAADPYGHHPNATRLQGRPGYRLRVGDWRVLYEHQDDRLLVLVLRIGQRGGVYR